MRYRVLAIGVLLVAGCEQGGGPVQKITEVREASARDTMPQKMSSAERLGFNVAGSAADHAPTMAGAAAPSAEAPYVWTKPAGWEELAPTSMRLANFLVGGDAGAECYFSKLGGDGGGVVDNVNRWRSQIGLEAVSAAEVAALPKMSLLGGEALYVSLEGAFKGMGDTAVEGSALAGLVMVQGGQAYFVKMTGPKVVVAAEQKNLSAFVASLREHDHALDHGAPTQAAAAPAPTQQISPPAVPTGDMIRESQISWDAPEGWLLAADRSMRVVTYMVGTSECVVSLWPGAVGGLAANINRWRQQMGQPPMSVVAIGALEKIEVLGKESTFVQIDGSYQDMAGNSSADAMMLGVMCVLEEQVLFVKLTGPKAEVLGEVDNFVAFSKTLRVGG